MIRIGREIQYLPYAGFFVCFSNNNIFFSFYLTFFFSNNNLCVQFVLVSLVREIDKKKRTEKVV